MLISLCHIFPLATGRTNVELREQLSRPEGVTQTMGAFTSKRHSEQKSTVVTTTFRVVVTASVERNPVNFGLVVKSRENFGHQVVPPNREAEQI